MDRFVVKREALKRQVESLRGKFLAGEKYPVVEIGEYDLSYAGCSARVPVRLLDNSYRFLWFYSLNSYAYVDQDNVIRNSKKMPTVNDGIGSDVINIRGEDDKGEFLFKVYYNQKAMYRDNEVYRYHE